MCVHPKFPGRRCGDEVMDVRGKSRAIVETRERELMA